MDVLIYVPYALEEAAGNSVTALRLRRQLREGGFSVTIITPRDELMPACCLIALNAWRSVEVVSEFEGPVVVLLTGTDINDPRVDDLAWEGRQVMERADCLVVLQKEAWKKVPEPLQGKCQVILPSVSFPKGLVHRGSSGSGLRVVLAGRFRPEKQSELVLEACRRLSKTAEVSVEWFGAVSKKSAPHFRWMGPVAQNELWTEMSRADVFLNASSEEGGANAVCEAIAMGLPVLASRIGGNVGLLGDDYVGYFESGNSKALTELLENPPLEEMRRQVQSRRSLFDYDREAEEWVRLVSRKDQSDR